MNRRAPADRPPGTPEPDPAGPALPEVARGGLLNLGGAALAGLSGVGVAWLAAHGLGPAGAGVFFATMAVFVLVGGVAKLGTPTGLVYWVARLRALGRSGDLTACLRAALVPVVVAAAVLAGALWIAAPWLAERLAGPHQPAATASLRVLAVFLPAAALADALLSATRGHRLMRPTVVLDRVLRAGLQLTGAAALTIAALWTVMPPAAWSLAWAAPYVPVAALAGYAALAATRRAAPSGPPPTARSGAAPDGGRAATGGGVTADFWRFTAPRAVAGTLQVALQRVDVLLVAALAGPAAAAVYTVAGRFLVVGQLVNQSIGDAVAPRLAERLSLGDRAGAGLLYRTATGWLVLTTWPLYLLALVHAPWYLGLFGEPYRQGAPIVAVLAAAMLLASACGPVDLLLTMAGRTGWNLGNVSLALAVMVGLDLLLVPGLGGLGAALGLAAAFTVKNLLPLLQVGLAMRLHPFGRGSLAAAALATACFGALPTVVAALAGTGPAALASALGLAGAGYLAGARRLAGPLALAALLRSARHPGRQTAPDQGRRAAGPSLNAPSADGQVKDPDEHRGDRHAR